MKPGYSVEELVKTFANHARESKHDFEKQKKEFMRNYPDEPLPAHFNNNFNISSALLSMCQEILKLKSPKV